MSLQEFRSNFTGGGARPNQFEVQLTFPGLAVNGGLAGQQAQFMCNATQLPGSFVNPAPVFYRGRQIPLAGERTFQPWTVNIYNDSSFVIRNAFESWSNAVNDLTNNSGEVNPSAYVADMIVTQLDRNGQSLKSYKFNDAWPGDISDIQLSYTANDQIEEFSVTFYYVNYETDFV